MLASAAARAEFVRGGLSLAKLLHCDPVRISPFQTLTSFRAVKPAGARKSAAPRSNADTKETGHAH
jgi:hypothetical protein